MSADTENEWRNKAIAPYVCCSTAHTLTLIVSQSDRLWRRMRRSEASKWCPGAELNHRHSDFQSLALPTELPGHCPALRPGSAGL